MCSIKSRLRRLEKDPAGGPCPKCRLPPDGPGRIVYSNRTGSGLSSPPEDSDERCPQCGRRLWLVIEVVYEGEGE
jgi:hypothetical protein